MIYRHAFLQARALDAIRAYVRGTWFRETGGPLVGYVSSDRALVMTHAGGPGPRAELAPFSVLIDGRAAEEFCGRIRRESEGRLDYVGDWHRHLGWSTKPSMMDNEAMRQMAAFEHSPVRNPISLIFRKWPEKYVTYILNKQGQLEVVESNTIATFEN